MLYYLAISDWLFYLLARIFSLVQFLPIPELMPFRLTRQFINLMLPMKDTGLISGVMGHALRAFRADPGLLTNTMDVFIKEPSFDWKVSVHPLCCSLRTWAPWFHTVPGCPSLSWQCRGSVHWSIHRDGCNSS